MTHHRECVPPSEPGGKDCSGEPIETKDCNTQDCPPPPEAKGEEEEEEDLPLKVEIKRVSYRPQRYETCILKEGDLEIVREDLT